MTCNLWLTIIQYHPCPFVITAVVACIPNLCFSSSTLQPILSFNLLAIETKFNQFFLFIICLFFTAKINMGIEFFSDYDILVFILPKVLQWMKSEAMGGGEFLSWVKVFVASVNIVMHGWEVKELLFFINCFKWRNEIRGYGGSLAQ